MRSGKLIVSRSKTGNEPGAWKTRVYRHIWSPMKARCENVNCKDYQNYGARGITLDPSWSFSYSNFIKDMGLPPSDAHEIDRRDNSKGYCKGNCRWSTTQEQNDNRTCTIWIEHDGSRKTLKAWCDQLGLKYITTHARIFRYGWTINKALTKVQHKKERK